MSDKPKARKGLVLIAHAMTRSIGWDAGISAHETLNPSGPTELPALPDRDEPLQEITGSPLAGQASNQPPGGFPVRPRDFLSENIAAGRSTCPSREGFRA